MAKVGEYDDIRRALAQAAQSPAFDALRRCLAEWRQRPEAAALRRFAEGRLANDLRASVSRIRPMHGAGLQWVQIGDVAAPTPAAPPPIDRGPGKPPKKDEVQTEARRIIRVEGKPRSKSALANKVYNNIDVALSTAKKWAYPIWDE
jgi:hypothetical protein